SARWLPAKPAMPVTRIFMAGSARRPPAAPAALELLTPVDEDVLQRHLEGDGGRPAGDALEAGAVAEEGGDVRWAQPLRILSYLHLDLSQGQQGLQHLADAIGPAGADVVDLAGRAVLEGEPVRADHVAHVGEIALGVEVPHAHHRRPQPLLDLGDLLGEVRGHEDVAAAGPRVIEAAGPDDVEPVALPVLVGEEVLRHLGHGVGRQRAKGVLFPDRELVREDEAVLLAGSGDLGPASQAQLAHALEQVELRLHVGQQRLGGHEPGGRHVALGGEMEDAVRGDRLEHPACGRRVPEVTLHELEAPGEVRDAVHAAPPAVGAEELDVAPGDQVVGQVAPDEAGQAGDQDSHARSPSKNARIEATTASTSASVSSGKQGSDRTAWEAAQAAGYAVASKPRSRNSGWPGIGWG